MQSTPPNQPNFKVNALSSLGAKLFFYMTTLVLLTIVGNSLQSMRSFMTFQTQQVQDSIQLTAERTGSQVENVIDTWRAQITVALPTLKGDDDEPDSAQLKKFVDSSHEFIGFMMLGSPTASSTVFTENGEAFTSSLTDPRFEDKIPAKVWDGVRDAAQKWLRRDAHRLRKGHTVMVESFTKTVGLPVMMTAIRFETADSKRVMWGVLATWQSNLLKVLPKSKAIEATIVDRQGKVFTSPLIADMLKRKKASPTKLLKAALGAPAALGFEPEYRTDGNKRRLGAYARLPKYGLTILVESDAELAYQALRRNLLSTALWATLFILLAVMFSYLGAKQITKNLRAVTLATERIAAGDFTHHIRPQSRDEIGLLALSVNHMSQRIVGLMKNQVERTRLEQELATAKLVQSTLFPRADSQQGALFITGFYQPANECGGDLWGHFTIRPGVEFIYVADAMGHGAPAAMVTAMAYATTMTVADIMREQPELSESPALVLERLNRIIFEAVRGSISMTAFAAVVDTNNGTVTYSNAGHNFPFIIPQSAADDRAGRSSAERAKKSNKPQPISLKQTGTPLGMLGDTSFKDGSIDLRAGDKLFLFTDGLIESSDPKGAVWGRSELLVQAVDTAHLAAGAMRDELLARAFRFYAAKPIDDDVTVVIVELDKMWTKSEEAPAKPAPSTDLEPSPPPAQSASVPHAPTGRMPAAQRPATPVRGALPPRPIVFATPASPQPATSSASRPIPPTVPPSRSYEPPGAAEKGLTAPETTTPHIPELVVVSPPAAQQKSVSQPPRPVPGISSPAAPAIARSIPSSPTSSPAPTPLGKNGKYKIKLPTTG